MPAIPFEVTVRFDQLASWHAWSSAHSHVRNSEHKAQLLDQISQHGIVDPLSQQQVPPSDVEILHNNYRETLRTGQLISRHRALLLELKHIAEFSNPQLLGNQCKVFAPEAITDFALLLRGRYPKFIGSEYAETDAERAALFPIPSEDLTQLSFPSEVFDLVITNDVLEHVPDIDAALRETARVLNPQGVMISTFPFASGNQHGIVRTRLQGHEIEHLLGPEYHGNPL